MKLLKTATAILAFSLASTFSQADITVNYTQNWGNQIWNGSAVINYKDYNNNEKILEGIIGHSKDGQQRFYLRDFFLNDLSTCKYESSLPDNITMILNGQAVYMSRFCNKYADASKYYYTFTPGTPRGHAFVVNLFKRSVSSVKIEYNGEVFYMPSKGFTKAWNTSGGNAI